MLELAVDKEDSIGRPVDLVAEEGARLILE